MAQFELGCPATGCVSVRALPLEHEVRCLQNKCLVRVDHEDSKRDGMEKMKARGSCCSFQCSGPVFDSDDQKRGKLRWGTPQCKRRVYRVYDNDCTKEGAHQKYVKWMGSIWRRTAESKDNDTQTPASLARIVWCVWTVLRLKRRTGEGAVKSKKRRTRKACCWIQCSGAVFDSGDQKKWWKKVEMDSAVQRNTDSLAQKGEHQRKKKWMVQGTKKKYGSPGEDPSRVMMTTTTKFRLHQCHWSEPLGGHIPMYCSFFFTLRGCFFLAQ